jgi:hypothetical protein
MQAGSPFNEVVIRSESLGRFNDTESATGAQVDAGILGQDDAAARAAVIRALGQPTPDRIRVIAQAFRHGLSVEEVNAA